MSTTENSDVLHLSVSRVGAQALHELLVSALSDLRMEISQTDSPAFRAGLREREEHLAGVRDALTAELAL